MNKSHKEVTIYDIAKSLKVSSATVSRALNKHSSISAKTTMKVQEMAKKMGYSPNILASGLRTNNTKTIGVITSWINRPFISSVISGIEEVANKAGYNVIISQSNDLFEKEEANSKALFASRVDGLIVSLAMETQQFDHFRIFVERKIPLVFVDRTGADFASDRILLDNFEAGYTATKHLVDQGFTRIAHLTGAAHREIYKERMEGYMAALRESGIEINNDMVKCSGLSYHEGWESMGKLLERNPIPQAVFCANDTSALGVIQCIKHKRLNVPDDIAVVGFNDDPLASIIDPQLTTMAQPAVEMGKIAAQQILKKLRNPEFITPETIVLKSRLVLRNSSVASKVVSK